MENENVETKQEDVNDSNDYIEAIKEIKKNTVAKEDYLKLREENKKLLTSLVNGEQIDNSQERPVDINEIRKKLFNKDISNLDYISNALELRQELINKGEKDPFLPYGKNILPTEEDIATANRVAKAFQDCVEYADGDSDIFTSELQRITVDTAPIRRNR